MSTTAPCREGLPYTHRLRPPAHDAANPPPFSERLAPSVRAMMDKAGYVGRGANARLAKDSGVDRSQIGRLVKGEMFWPDIYTLKNLADTLLCSLDDLVGRQWPPVTRSRFSAASARSPAARAQSRPVKVSQVQE